MRGGEGVFFLLLTFEVRYLTHDTELDQFLSVVARWGVAKVLERWENNFLDVIRGVHIGGDNQNSSDFLEALIPAEVFTLRDFWAQIFWEFQFVENSLLRDLLFLDSLLFPIPEG